LFFFSFSRGDDRGFLKEGVKTYLLAPESQEQSLHSLAPTSPLNSSTFFMSSHQ
jgi:hypothetical protein